jgi:hypothetical protein
MGRNKLFINGHRTINIRPDLYEKIADEGQEAEPRQLPSQVLEKIVVKHFKDKERD